MSYASLFQCFASAKGCWWRNGFGRLSQSLSRSPEQAAKQIGNKETVISTSAPKSRRESSLDTRCRNDDVTMMKGWPEVFETTDKAQVERIAESEGMPIRWEGKNDDTFVSEYISEPFQLYPKTNDAVWFNHAQVFHWTSFPAELFFAFTETREWQFLARVLLVGIKSVIQYGIFRKRMAMDVRFGDGSPISWWEMHMIRKAIHKNMVLNRWQQGDLVMIDNFSTSHGRQPTYDGGRKIVVGWSDTIEKENRA